MASNTSHYNLVKPAYDEAADVAVINGNMDTIDSQMYSNEQGVNDLQNGLAIVANGNTHVAITAGQYVFVKNHGTLANGLYVATSNIAANATLSSSNLTLETSGGLNALNSNISVYNLDTNSLKTYADSLPAGAIRHVWYGASNPDSPTNKQGYCKIISKASDVKMLIATTLEGHIYTLYRYGTWSSTWLNVG